MKGQKIMKHSFDLIGQLVHVYRMDWKRPDRPRPGVITGFGDDKGLFVVTVTHDYVLDCRGSGKPSHGFMPMCLVVDDKDDMPIGVTEWACLRSGVQTNQAVRGIDELIVTDDPVTDDPVTDDPVTDDPGSSAAEADEDAEEESRPAHQQEQEHGAEKNDKERPAGETAIKILMNSSGWEPIVLLGDAISTEIVSKNELAITLAGDERSIARIVWTPRNAPMNEVESKPFGFTIKVRDAAGRCSKVLAKHLAVPENVDKAVLVLRDCIVSAMNADLGDWGSSSANMLAVLSNRKLSNGIGQT